MVRSWKGRVGAILPWVRIPSPLNRMVVAECDHHSCQLTLSLTTKENSPKYRLQNRKHKFSGVKNLVCFKDTEIFTIKRNKLFCLV